MTSQARIDANRLNAQLSTGPRTEQGKQASSKNATKHGFFARLLPRDYGTPAFQDMLTGLYYALRPADEMQQILVDQIGIAYLRLARLYQQELQPPTTPPASPDADSTLDAQYSTLTLRYETMLTRQIERNFKLLNQARELGWSLGRMLEDPTYFLPDFTPEDPAPDPDLPDDGAPDTAETSHASPAVDTWRAEDTPHHAFETGEPASTLEPPANSADTVAHPCRASAAQRRLRAGVQAPSCADHSQAPSCADDPQHSALSTQHQSFTPVPDHIVWLPGNLHQIDPITGVMRCRSERPAR